jgi:hypothetical protein
MRRRAPAARNCRQASNVARRDRLALVLANDCSAGECRRCAIMPPLRATVPRLAPMPMHAKRCSLAASLVAALMLASFPAQAAWEQLATSQIGDRKIDIYIDPDRIREQDGHKMVWQLDNLKDDVPKDQARSAVRLFALDCAKMSTALADIILYKGDMGKGTSLGRNVSKKLEFEPALPDSVAELLLFRVCIPPDQQKLLMQGDSKKPAGEAAPKAAPTPSSPAPEPAKK